MFGFTGIKLAIYGIIALAVVTSIGLAYTHYQGLLVTIQTLKSNEVKFNFALSKQSETIEIAEDRVREWQQNAEKMKELYEEVFRENETANSEVKRLNGLFSKHNLAKLAKAKPGLIEKRINAGTINMFRMLQCASNSNKNCERKITSTSKNTSSTGPKSSRTK